jgi:hypothetical protein
MAGRVVFRMNPRFPAEAVRTAEVEVFLRAVADRVAERAKRALGAVDPDEEIEVELDEDHRGKIARVVNRHWKGIFLEFGTVRSRAHPHLRPALMAEGLKPAPRDGSSGA